MIENETLAAEVLMKTQFQPESKDEGTIDNSFRFHTLKRNGLINPYTITITPLFAQIITEHLNNIFANYWIGNRASINCPARSPDLTPLDFCSGAIKDIVYQEQSLSLKS